MGKKGQKSENKDAKQVERNTRSAIRAEKKGRRNGEADEDYANFQTQLQIIGLRLKDILGDGNCLFRAIADQLLGDHTKHAQIRKDALDFMEANSPDFAPFVVDTPFKKYVDRLRKDGVYGGNDTIVAAARHYRVDIVIHHLGQARWVVSGSEDGRPCVRELHIAYHDYEHYSSVRPIVGDEKGPSNIRLAGRAEAAGPDKSKGKGKGEGKGEAAARGKAQWHVAAEEQEDFDAAIAASVATHDDDLDESFPSGATAAAVAAAATGEGDESKDVVTETKLQMLEAATGISDRTMLLTYLLQADGDTSLAVVYLQSAEPAAPAPAAAAAAAMSPTAPAVAHDSDDSADTAAADAVAAAPAPLPAPASATAPAPAAKAPSLAATAHAAATPTAPTAPASAPAAPAAAAAAAAAKSKGKGEERQRHVSARERKESAKQLKKQRRAQERQEAVASGTAVPDPSGGALAVGSTADRFGTLSI